MFLHYLYSCGNDLSWDLGGINITVESMAKCSVVITDLNIRLAFYFYLFFYYVICNCYSDEHMGYR